MPPSPCDSCGQIQSYLIKSPVEARTIEPSDVDEELIRVGAQIHQLIQLQAGLLGRVNQQRSHVYALPVELLTTILLYACASYMVDGDWRSFIRQAVSLSSVSSHWRKIIFQTPKFWNTVVLRIHDDIVESSAALFQHCLGLAKNTYVVVELHLSTESRMMDRALHYQPIADVLFAPQNASRIKSLWLMNPPGAWLTKLSQLINVRGLLVGNLRNENDAPTVVDLRIHSLKKLFLVGKYWVGSIILPSSLQTLITTGLLLDVNLALLRQCPNLLNYFNWGSSSRVLPSSASNAAPLTLSRLKTLTWSANVGFGDSASIHSLPALEYLHLIGINNEPAVPVIIFCHQHAGTLKLLRLHSYSSWQAGDVRRLLLYTMPLLEELELLYWPLSHLIEAVCTLTPSDEEFAHNEVKVLPRLRYLELTAFEKMDAELETVLSLLPTRSGDDVADVFGPFLGMLERRRAGRSYLFRLGIPALWRDGERLTWSAQLRNKFASAIKGCRIKISEDDEPLEWLH